MALFAYFSLRRRKKEPHEFDFTRIEAPLGCNAIHHGHRLLFRLIFLPSAAKSEIHP